MAIAEPLRHLIEDEVLPALHIDASVYWSHFEKILKTFMPQNRELLAKRDSLQAQIDAWCDEHRAQGISPDGLSPEETRQFLQKIGYITPAPEPFTISTDHVDEEVASIAGPQLVVPVSNARYALNAANARWGSLYDALYGADVIPETAGFEKGDHYNPVRGEKVVVFAMEFLDRTVPLASGSHADVSSYTVILEAGRRHLAISLKQGGSTSLAEPDHFVGFQGDMSQPEALLLCHHHLHIEIQIDREHPVGRTSAAGVKDVLLEAAITTIQDCEDSVAAVDAEDKAQVYRNWLGLMRGDLAIRFNKGHQVVERGLNSDRVYQAPEPDRERRLPGRSLLLIRNVGLLMLSDAILCAGEPVPEGILDAMITATIALYDLRSLGQHRNSRLGSVYIVKPKLHGPEEVAFTRDLFGAVESALDVPVNTLKIGIMDEERRTTVNLQACIFAARERVIFINTGFLDRTGDEMHTSMRLGPMVRKDSMKQEAWLAAYEAWNVECGLAAGFHQRAQIGKGMWPKPDKMAQMMETKQAHPLSGANCAWVPSPTAATLHAMHYHAVDVAACQLALQDRLPAENTLLNILRVPLHQGDRPSDQDIQEELDNNAQGILGYVVRWIDQGVGCSKVPDIHDVGLMEDRATLRISSQHIANWLYHGWVSTEQVMETFQRMAAVVDRQNADDALYQPMAVDFEHSIAFQAACDLVFKGCEQPNGYTELILHARRQEMKARAARSS
ncbi:MAG: malate synthase G [Gammaproteobacteria bacterium]